MSAVIHTDCMGDLLLDREVKHGGPGPHEGTGSPQAVHRLGAGPLISWPDIEWAHRATQMLQQRRHELDGPDLMDPFMEQVEASYTGYRSDPSMTLSRWLMGGAGGRHTDELARGLPDATPEQQRRLADAATAFREKATETGAWNEETSRFAPTREGLPDLIPEAMEVFEAALDIRGLQDRDPDGDPWRPELPDTSEMDEIAERFPDAPFNVQTASLRRTFVQEEWDEHARLLREQGPDEKYPWPLIDTPEALEYKRELARSIGDPEESVVAVRVPWDVLPKVIETGRVLNQHESGGSNAHYGPAKRKRAENVLFGLPERGMKLRDRPVYGYVADREDPTKDDSISVDQYGNVVMVMKDDVRARTTITNGDSLDSTEVFHHPASQPGKEREKRERRMGPFPGVTERQKEAWRMTAMASPLPIDAVNEDTIDIATSRYRWRGIMKPDVMDPEKPLTSVQRYVEAQVHGGLTLDDIDHIIVKRPVPEGIPPELLSSLEEHGIEIRPHPEYEGVHEW